MLETIFHDRINKTLTRWYERLDPLFDDGTLEELDYEEGEGILTIITPDNSTFILSRHQPTRQLWFASPLSGGLHFIYDEAQQHWALKDGTTLDDAVTNDLKAKNIIC